MEIPPFLRLDLEGVKQWIKKVKTNHAGEEDTKHYQEEMEMINSIKSQLEKGEIEFYPQFDLYADEISFSE